MTKAFTIIGASGHGKVVIEIIEESGDKISRIIDDDESITDILEYKVTSQHLYQTPVIITIGDNLTRKTMAARVNYEYGTAIHPKSVVSSRSIIGEGSVVMAGAIINSAVSLGRHCIVNTNASIDHDCEIADFVHISPGASIGGNVRVGEGSHIGIGSTVIQGITIGKWAVIGAGSVIIRDVPDNAVVAGVPGRIIKYREL